MRVLRGALGIALVVLALAACGAPSSSEGQLPESYAGYAVEDMIAAYAPIVDDMLSATDNSFTHSVLSDGYVTESEIAEGRSRQKQCMADEGFDDVVFMSDGTMSVGFEDGMEYAFGGEGASACEDNVECRCEVSTGYGDVQAMYSMMQVNPLNEDMDALTLECLKAKNILEPGTTVPEYQSLFENDSELISLPEFRACAVDPLGLLPEEPTEIDVR